jgi:hypothetical protein
LQIEYEVLASKPESTIKNMISFLSVDWDDRCLEFHKSKRPVMTPSFNQVNQPMNTKSFERWKNYEPFLTPLIEALDS